MRIRYSPRALHDITAILAYLERHSPQGAQNVARAMRKTIDLIGQFPQSGRPVSEFGVRATGRAISLSGLLECRSGWRLDHSHSAYGSPTLESGP
jgi:plasmid stabilization system protein ParE